MRIDKIIKERLLLLLFLLPLLVSSCSISNRFSVGDSRYFELRLIEDLGNNEVLASSAVKDDETVVKIVNFKESYSFWRRINGKYTCVDYWTYVTVKGVVKTVPVVVKESEYEFYIKQR